MHKALSNPLAITQSVCLQNFRNEWIIWSVRFNVYQEFPKQRQLTKCLRHQVDVTEFSLRYPRVCLQSLYRLLPCYLCHQKPTIILSYISHVRVCFTRNAACVRIYQSTFMSACSSCRRMEKTPEQLRSTSVVSVLKRTAS